VRIFFWEGAEKEEKAPQRTVEHSAQCKVGDKKGGTNKQREMLFVKRCEKERNL